MSRFIKNIVLIAVAVILVPLSVANRHPVSISLNPFDPQDPNMTVADVPLFWIFFASLALGIMLGGIGAWAKQGKWRNEARFQRKEADKWHREADAYREQQQNTAARTALPGNSDRNAA